ncbi:hypothetical protein ABFS82_09G039000 [Erythranthe guttata]|uniref:Uncharacterized protein n=1 Tax=Erythranthe guttata TaxID=4155 RepID=A0A022R7X3_ERYGU|nr:hypothetical protein MIMGU_mgv1a018182mg [Erythranthe guttata]
MGCLSYYRIVVLAVFCIGFLSLQPENVSGSRNSSRFLNAAFVAQDLNIAPSPSKTFNPNESQKRRVRRGSDPIHNKC